MTSLPENECQILLVSRERLQHALGILAGSLDSKTRWASLSHKDGQLKIVAGMTNCDVEAKGHWPETIFIDANWVRGMGGLIPPGDPIILRAEGGHFYTNRFSQLCRLDIPQSGGNDPTSVSRKSRANRVDKAAKLLSPFRVSPEDLESMIESVQSRGVSVWRRDERQMVALVAKAWAVLAPLGVETGDLRDLIDNAVTNAFFRT